MAKKVSGMMLVLLALVAAGCETTVPASDPTAPEITVTVAGGRGDNIFRSADGEFAPPDDCVKVEATPVRLNLVVSDAGGVRFAAVTVLDGTIVPASLEVTPPRPEARAGIRSSRATETLEITLAPSSSGTVRTGAAAVFEVDGAPLAITASATDQAGNRTLLPQFDLRLLDDAVLCRGEG